MRVAYRGSADRGIDGIGRRARTPPGRASFRALACNAIRTLDQPSGFGGREGFVERCLAVEVEVVLDLNDGRGLCEVPISQIFQDVCGVHRGSSGRQPRLGDELL